MQKNNGFTLIELMVAIAVLAVVASIAAPSFSNLLIKENLKTTAFNMRDTLKEARSRALLNRASTVVCTSLSKSASAVTQDGCGANLTNYATTMSASLKKDSVFVVNVEKKINVKSTSSDSFVFFCSRKFNGCTNHHFLFFCWVICFNGWYPWNS